VPQLPTTAPARQKLLLSLPSGVLVLALAALPHAPLPASVPSRPASAAGFGPATHGPHSMSAAEMEGWVREWYAAHPARGERSLATAVDTFLVGNIYFDADGDPSTTVDTVRAEVGQTVMWRWESGSHTTTNGRDVSDPDAGRLWDQPVSAATPEFRYQFDSSGVFPFICRPHSFLGMRGVVIASNPGGADVAPPYVQLLSPYGGERFPAHQPAELDWQAVDDVGVVGVDLFYRDADGAPWVTLARDLPNTGSFSWFVHDTPTAQARVRVVARDAAGNAAADTSDEVFTIEALTGGRVATTLRDFIQPGTQPLDGGTFLHSDVCLTCHGGYDAGVEPGTWKGTMMSQSARDPLFYACLAVAEQDAPASGDLCIRCHAATGWLSGRSVPTDGSRLTAQDRDGVSCGLCHRLVDPHYQAGVSPPRDQTILGGLLPAHRPTGYANGQYVIDPDPDMRRGPFTYTAAPHPFMESDFHRRGDLCGTCHDVSNPVFTRSGAADFTPGPLDRPADSLGVAWLMPIERTYSEWRHSDYPAGVYAPEFAGSKPFGVVSTCQDCHERDVVGEGCNPDSFPNAPLRSNLPFHDMTGGNAWMPMALLGLAGLYPGELDPAAQQRVAARATEMLRKAAVLAVSVERRGDTTLARVTVTNRSGHKLPTGYPEGRRMWLEVRARDAAGSVIYESGAYDAVTGTLNEGPEAVVYEAHLGLSPTWASQLGLSAGPSFHFVLNDTVYKDNRIPPRGFSNAAFAGFGGAPVDASRPGSRYADGQYWDEARFSLPAAARSVAVALRYQSTSREYVEFLRDENHTNDAGQRLYDLWSAHGKSEPVVMAYDSVAIEPIPTSPGRAQLRTLANPFGDVMRLELTLAGAARVTCEVFDAAGRRVWSKDYGVLGGGPTVLTWSGKDGRGSDAGSGPFWVRVRAGGETFRRTVVRVR
jgi:plastocyanin